MEMIHVGLDAHKDTIAVAVAVRREVRDAGPIRGDLHAARLMRGLVRTGQLTRATKDATTRRWVLTGCVSQAKVETICKAWCLEDVESAIWPSGHTGASA
jgi:hypothetical protein